MHYPCKPTTDTSKQQNKRHELSEMLELPRNYKKTLLFHE